jgi:hypothetical protein
MGSSITCARLLTAVSVLLLPGLTGNGLAEPETPEQGIPPEGFRIEQIEQKRTDVIAWLRVQVVANTGPEQTWEVVQNMQAYPDFLEIFPEVRAVERAGTMTRYRLSVSPPWPVRNFHSLVWIAKLQEQRVILWRKEREGLSGSHGKIAVEAVQGGTRVIYEIQSPVESAFPPWVVRIGLYLVLPGVAQDFYDRIKQLN